MRKSNTLDLDGRILRTFLAILEHSSVSIAAEDLNVTQPAVSHALAKLRRILDDPLFVRSGTGLTPTSTAIALKQPVQKVLDGLRALADHRPFDPASEHMHFVIAANDMQRDLVFPQLVRELRSEGFSVEFEFIPSGHPTLSMMRDAKCDLALTPVPPEAPDLRQESLFSGTMVCFYDADEQDPPGSWEEFCRAEHLGVKFAEGHVSLDVLHAIERGIDKSRIRRPQISVPNFNAIPLFIKGSRLIATELDLMQLETLKSLDSAPLPFESEPVTVFMVWHDRGTNDPAHIWLRRRIQRIAGEVQEKMAVRRAKAG
jgi:DNA-binding transcriptional LysR family regulator